MKFEIYHQIGHNHRWNIESITKDGVGDGIIISPRNMSKTIVEKLDVSIRERAIFDPQFFDPYQINNKMKTYDFYPHTTMPSGFGTSEYSDYSTICASECSNFQQSNNFRYFVIPTRYIESVPNTEDFIDLQNRHYIIPFLQVINEEDLDKEIIVQLTLNSHMIKNDDYANELLNWITGIEGINGVYLITKLTPRDKQIKDPMFLYSLLKFIDALSQNDLIVILGYLNTEAILLSIANPSIVTIGSYENVRYFKPETFVYDESNGVKSLKPRIYIPVLLDWIEAPFVEALVKKVPEYKDYLGRNAYTSEILSPTYNWNSIKTPYKHFFVESSKQLRRISQVEGEDRATEVCRIIEEAIQEHARVKKAGIILTDPGTHLNSWLTAANLFMADRGWRS